MSLPRLSKMSKVFLTFLFALFSLAIVIPMVIFLCLQNFVLTTEQLTAQVVREVNARTPFQFDCERVELSYWETWPLMSITIHSGHLSQPGLCADSTWLPNALSLSFRKVSGSMEMTRFFKERQLNILDLRVVEPQLSMRLDAALSKKVEKETSPQDRRAQKVQLSIRQIEIEDGRVCLTDSTKGIYVASVGDRLWVKGDLIAENPTFDLEVQLDTLSLRHPSGMNQQVSFQLKGDCAATDRWRSLAFDQMHFMINQFPFHLSGNLAQEDHTLRTDLRFALEAVQLEDLLALASSVKPSELKDYQISGTTLLEGKMTGLIGKDTLPDVWVKGRIAEGSVKKISVQQSLEDINLDFMLQYRSVLPDSCFVELSQVSMKGLNSQLHAKGRVDRFADAPFITADLKGSIDFDYIGRQWIDPKIAMVKGKLDADFSTAFRLDDLLAGHFHRVWATGTMLADCVEARSEDYALDTFVSGLKMDVGYKKNKSDFIAAKEVLSASADIDSLRLEWGDQIFVNLSRLHLRSNTVVPSQEADTPPVTLHLDCATLQAKLSDRAMVKGERVEFHAGTKALAAGASLQNGAALLKLGTFHYVDVQQQQTLQMNQCEFMAEGIRNQSRTSSKRDGRSPWQIKAMLGFEESKAYTALFPLIVHSRQGRINFQNNQILLNRLHLQAGNSDCLLSGYLSTLPSEKDSKPRIEGMLQLLSNHLDYDELKQTYLYGDALSKELKTGNVLPKSMDLSFDQVTTVKPVNVEEHPILLPDWLDLELQMDLAQMTYQQIAIQQLKGNLHLAPSRALLDASARTNLGKADLKLLYDSRQPTKPRACFDLNFKDILVAQMHQVLPTVATMFPLVKSMDGLIDCRLTAEGELNNQMFPELSATYAVCSLNGMNLKLSDSEIFQEIARKFKFKNKQYTEIDRLSANCVLQNHSIDVIPFPIELDRYKAIVGGKHSTDLTFDYHITLLKSPIPIDFGVNLTGKEGDFHYKIGKCQYKQLYKDGGVSYNQQVRERLQKMRDAITQHIQL